MNSPSNNSHPFPPFENNSGSGQQRRRIITIIIMRPTLSFFNFNVEEFDFVANMERRSYRTLMKPRLARKATASARINLNRFWNELEEFYDRRTKNNNNCGMAMPDYTTDIHDHAREEAENRANERLEEEEEEEREAMIRSAKSSKVSKGGEVMANDSNLNVSARMRLHSYDVVDAFEASSDDEEEDYEYDYYGDSMPSSPVTLMFNDLTSDVKLPSPPPPKSLLQLVSMMADKF